MMQQFAELQSDVALDSVAVLGTQRGLAALYLAFQPAAHSMAARRIEEY